MRWEEDMVHDGFEGIRSTTSKAGRRYERVASLELPEEMKCYGASILAL